MIQTKNLILLLPVVACWYESSATPIEGSSEPGILADLNFQNDSSTSAHSTASDTDPTIGDSSGTGGYSGGGSQCDNGILEINEECEGSVRCNNCLRDRLVFITSVAKSGNLGGIKGADELCDYLAKSATNPWITPNDAEKEKRHWQAWLSGFEAVNERLIFGKGRYVRVDNKVVVNSGLQFYEGKLEIPINLDESGQNVKNYAWTNTFYDGTIVSNESCKNWTSFSAFDSSIVGWSDKMDQEWTVADNGVNPTLCSLQFHLFCVETVTH
jgi:archaellum component FlaF (FlaF/FlaG flagellin family)